MDKTKIIVVEDNIVYCEYVCNMLSREGYRNMKAYHLSTAKKHLQQATDNDIVVADLRLPDGSGIDLLCWMRKEGKMQPFIIMTDYAEVNTAVESMKLGSIDYIPKQLVEDKLVPLIRSILKERQAGQRRMPVFAREGSAFQKIMHRIRLVAATDMSVMIFGENGTGKEHIAHLLHDKSKRAGKPFVAVDCGSLSKELAPSAFFGHVKGAFTGADNAKKGYFHEAEGGTLFLDEVGNLALETQQMLLRAIQERRYRSVMINYNPETVSTDYDICDRLYFDELTFERVLDIIEKENPHGVIVSTGGQIPNNLALRLDSQGVHILGTSATSIDNAEDRDKFSAMLDRIGVDQPEWRALTSMKDIAAFIDKVGFPVLVRPSYVLSGAAMNVCSNEDELNRFLKLAANVSQKHPVVVSRFIEHSKEIEMDAVAQDGEIVAYAISEHIEFAGVHSGDATIQFPPQKLYIETVRRIKRISRKIAKELNISGPFNIQYLARDNDIKVIECNLRASRSFPFVSKVLKLNFIDMATRIMLGKRVEKPAKSLFDLDYVGIKASQFSFNRLQNADPVLGVDMASTGEVGCLGEDTQCAILKAMLSVGYRIPQKNILLSTGDAKQKADMLSAARLLQQKGYSLFATGGTSRYLSENGIDNTLVYWPDEKREPQALGLLHRKEIDMVVNIPKDLSVGELDNGYQIRRAAVDLNIPLLTNARLASAFISAFCSLSVDDLIIKSWAEYENENRC